LPSIFDKKIITGFFLSRGKKYVFIKNCEEWFGKNAGENHCTDE